MLDIQKIKDGVQLAAQEYPIKKAELFGSYANGTNRPDSDVDLLLEFKSPRISLLTLSAIKYRLEDIQRVVTVIPAGKQRRHDQRIQKRQTEVQQRRGMK